MRSIDILLVDDNDDDVLIVRESFADAENVRVVDVVHDGEQAIRYLRRQGEYKSKPTPTLVLLDINMPRMNGFEVLEEIKNDPELSHIPIVMLTTSARDEDVQRSYANGACSFITKPVDFDTFAELARGFALYWSSVATLPGQNEV